LVALMQRAQFHSAGTASEATHAGG
jgi:hypothetical protein